MRFDVEHCLSQKMMCQNCERLTHRPLTGDDAGHLDFNYRLAPGNFTKLTTTKMKKVLLVGRQLVNVPPLDQLIKNVEYFAAANLADAQKVFEANNNAIDIVIMGAGIELEKRLEIVRYIFNTSHVTSVHMKDWITGPEGFVPFINHVLNGLLHSEDNAAV